MKKLTAILISILMLTLCACQGSTPPPPQKSSTSSSQVSEDTKEPEVLRVVTDIDCLSVSTRVTETSLPSQAKAGKQLFRSMLNGLGGTPNGLEVELEILPTNKDDYNFRLTELRTSIMAGSGPDVFIMSGFGGCDETLPDSSLFLNPESAMKKGLFLPLDKYVENARFMDMAKLHPKVMEAGCYDGKRYILPMFYRLPIVCLYTDLSIPLEEVPQGWDGALACDDTEVRTNFAFAMIRSGFRQVVFGQAADNAKEELLLDQEDFFMRTKEAIELYRDYPIGLPYEQTGCVAWGDMVAGGRASGSSGYKAVFAPRNSAGGVNAAIEHYCAVNANTKHPEDAFFIADMLLGEGFQSMEKFWGSKTSYDDSSREMSMFWMMAKGNVPVYTDFLTTKQSYKNAVTYKDVREALAKAEDEIDFVYFTGSVDKEIDRMFRELIEMVEKGETLTDADIRKATDKTYTTMKMMLAES